MATTTQFRGWSRAAPEFYRQLEADNTKAFWQAHKAVYEDEVRAPFDALGDLVEDEFGPLKVFRPYRDVRFSRDKTPYKTSCYAVAGEEGRGASYYVGLSADGLVAGAGYWMMATDQLDRYRQAVDDEETGAALADAVATVAGRGLAIEGHELKTAPRGYPRDHPRVDLLRRKSIAALASFGRPRWLATPAAADRIIGAWRDAAPLTAWLDGHVGPTTVPARSRF